MEELCVGSKVWSFIGVLEHKFTDKLGNEYEEVNLIFEVETLNHEPVSKEDHLEFIWCPGDRLMERNLLPSSLPRLLEGWNNTKTPFHKRQDDRKSV